MADSVNVALLRKLWTTTSTPVRSLAGVFGVSVTTLHEIAAANLFPRRPRGPRPAKAVPQQEFIEAYNAGATYTAMSERFGLSRSATWRMARRLKLPGKRA